MDGSNRQVLHSTGLTWPNGLTIDYADQRIYWADASLDRIEYSNVDGSERVILETQDNGLAHPFGLTLDKNILYWTELSAFSVYSTHKFLGQNIVPIYENILFAPSGIAAVSASRQPASEFICVLWAIRLIGVMQIPQIDSACRIVFTLNSIRRSTLSQNYSAPSRICCLCLCEKIVCLMLH